ncbi:hypothetical protein K492DRAFT_211726 [Lichtheimia hyalospora FSU 10163]|nr:hypothetical protein K492DRAFT_211726 [Lichtheimia hyalospora FSU 10163]
MSQPPTTSALTTPANNSASHDLGSSCILDDMAKINKLYTFGILCIGMGVGSTAVNKIMKPDMSIPVRKATTNNHDNEKTE